MADGLYKQVLDRVVTVLQGENLDGIRDDEIKVREFPEDGEITHAGVTVSPAEEQIEVYTTDRDLYSFPCIITVNKGTGKDTEDIDPRTKNRKTIAKAFHYKRDPAETLCNGERRMLPCTMEYGPQNLPEQYRKNWSTNRVVVWFRFTETRV